MNAIYAIIGSNGSTVEFDNQAYSISQMMISGFAGYPVSYDTSSPPGHTGEVLNSVSIVPRKISCSVRIWGDNRAQLEALREHLINALNPILGKSQFCWRREDGRVFVLDVVPEPDSPTFTKGTDNQPKYWDCTLTLVAHNPAWRTAEPEVVPIVGIGGGFTLPFTLPFTLGTKNTTVTINNTGTIDTPVLIQLRGRLDAPITIQNQTTGEIITIREDLGSNEILEIDTSDDNLHVTHTTAEGVTTDALHFCSVTSKFWHLQPGQNVITYNADDESDLASGTLTYYQRWAAI